MISNYIFLLCVYNVLETQIRHDRHSADWTQPKLIYPDLWLVELLVQIGSMRLIPTDTE